MKVSVVVGGIFHVPMLAENLQKLNSLEKLITSYPKFLFKKINPNLITIIPRPTQLFEFGFKIRPPKEWIEFDSKLFGKLASYYINKNTDVLYGWACFSLEGGRKMKRYGKKFVLDRPCPHVLFQEKLLIEESNKLNIKFESASKKFRCRNLKEYELADKIIVPSNYTYNSFIDYGFPKEKLFKIPLPGKINLLGSEEIDKRKKKDEIFRVGFIGGNLLRKGTVYLLEAWDKLNLKNAELMLKAPEKQLRQIPKINNLLNKLKNVRFVGYYKDINEFYLDLDIFCLPSIDDGFGMVLIEAMAHKIPVITSKNVGASEYIKDGDQGFILPIRDSEAIAEKIKKIYYNKTLAKKMGEKAYSQVKKKFTQNSYKKRISELLEEMKQ